jgi:hypothetical protein
MYWIRFREKSDAPRVSSSRKKPSALSRENAEKSRFGLKSGFRGFHRDVFLAR